MKPIKIIKTILTAALAISLCGCIDISNREFIPESTSEAKTEAEEENGVGGNLLITSSQNESEAHARPAVINANSFSDKQEKFISSCFFMGDSICSGFSMYGLSEHCCAKAGVAARNIDEFTFEYGNNTDQVAPLTAIVNSGMKNLVFMMGINDVNIETAEEYAEYYDSFYQRWRHFVPMRRFMLCR